MRVGYTSGVFDVFHVGHLNLLRRARLHCDFLFVAVCLDDVALTITGQRPLTPYPERLAIIRASRFVDAAVGKPTVDTLQMWEQLQFDVLFKGGDWATDSRGAALEKRFEGLPVEIVYLPFTASLTMRDDGSDPDQGDNLRGRLGSASW